jgi:hypothetical protein
MTPEQQAILKAAKGYVIHGDEANLNRVVHPRASWRQIWREVPNHYAHERSMRGALAITR